MLYKLVCTLTLLGRDNKLRQVAIQKLNLKSGDIVLDLACGTGLNLKFLEKVVGPNGKIIALDKTPEMLTVAKKKAKQFNWTNIEFILGDATDLLPDIKVDGVISTLGITVIRDHRRALINAISLLKINKRITILDAQLPVFWHSLALPFAKLYHRWASFDYTKNIPQDMQKLISNLEIKRYNLGTIYIAYGTKNQN